MDFLIAAVHVWVQLYSVVEFPVGTKLKNKKLVHKDDQENVIVKKYLLVEFTTRIVIVSFNQDSEGKTDIFPIEMLV